MNTENKFYKIIIISAIIAFFVLLDYWCLKLSNFAAKKFGRFDNSSIDFKKEDLLNKSITNNSTINEINILIDKNIAINVSEKSNEISRDQKTINFENSLTEAIKNNSRMEKNRLNINTDDENKINSNDRNTKNTKNTKNSTEIIIISPTNTMHFPINLANETNKEELMEKISNMINTKEINENKSEEILKEKFNEKKEINQNNQINQNNNTKDFDNNNTIISQENENKTDEINKIISGAISNQEKIENKNNSNPITSNLQKNISSTNLLSMELINEKEIDSNKSEDENESNNSNLYYIASFLSIFVFMGVILLALEIFKNQKKAKIVLVENNEIERKFQYELIDNEENRENKLNALELAAIQEI